MAPPCPWQSVGSWSEGMLFTLEPHRLGTEPDPTLAVQKLPKEGTGLLLEMPVLCMLSVLLAACLAAVDKISTYPAFRLFYLKMRKNVMYLATLEFSLSFMQQISLQLCSLRCQVSLEDMDRRSGQMWSLLHRASQIRRMDDSGNTFA